MIPKEIIKVRELFGFYSKQLFKSNSVLQEAYSKFLVTPNAKNEEHLDKSVKRTLNMFHMLAIQLGYVKK